MFCNNFLLLFTQVLTFYFPDCGKLAPPVVQVQAMSFKYGKDKVSSFSCFEHTQCVPCFYCVVFLWSPSAFIFSSGSSNLWNSCNLFIISIQIIFTIIIGKNTRQMLCFVCKGMLKLFDQGLQILLMSAWSQFDFCFTNFGVILEYLESSSRLSSTWSWHVYTIVRDTRSSCGGPLTWKAQIHDGGHRVNFDRNLPSSCFVVQYNSLISMT